MNLKNNCYEDIKFINFTPSKEMIQFISFKLQEIERKSPSDACLHLKIIKEKIGWIAKFELQSRNLKFNCIHKSIHEACVLDDLFLDLLERLDKWAKIKHIYF
ncbi:MAG: hypothetical protein HOO06_09000 [Bdellovibrionaceae bacterium]|jgi:hypothetical protein|nr:hypothetical protein [Pseudobdellovibrionaceae bacterium]